MEEKMKNKILICIPIIFLVLIIGLYSLAELKKEIYGTTLNYSSAKSLFGEQEFNINEFKKGNLVIRSKMAVNLLKKNQLKGTEIEKIRSLLGETRVIFLAIAPPLIYLMRDGTKTRTHGS